MEYTLPATELLENKLVVTSRLFRKSVIHQDSNKWVFHLISSPNSHKLVCHHDKFTC